MSGLVQIGRVVSFVVLGMLCATVVELSPWTLPLIVLNSPLTLNFSAPWLIAAIHIVLVCSGTEVLFQRRPQLERIRVPHSARAWLLPALIGALGPLLVARFSPLSAGWLLVFVGTPVVLGLALLCEYCAVDLDSPHFVIARAGLITLIYTTALLIYITVYSYHVRTMLSGTLIVLATFLLALSLLRWTAGQGTAHLPFALVIAVWVGLATWGLNRLAVNGLVGGSLLLLIFYIITGISQQFMQERVSRRALVEFAVAAVLGLLLLIGFGFQ